ncbi:MAG: DUF1736 domain-containing protein [Bacteroidia bacterium]
MKAKKLDTTLEKNDKFNRQILFIIFVFTMLLYSNSIKNNYALDDNYVTVTNVNEPGNSRVSKGIRGIPNLFKTHYVEDGEQSYEYRPLVLTTFAIEYQFFGSNPHVSHFISVLLYAFSCMLLFTILAKLFKNYTIIFPLLITFLFIIHPIHTEVVDNVKCRDELLSFLFGLCATHFFLKSLESKHKHWLFISLMLLFLLLGLLCKQTSILFFGLILLIAYFFSSVNLKKLIWIACLFFITYMSYNLFKEVMVNDVKIIREFVFFENPLYYEHSFLTRIPVVFYTAGYYLKLLVFPYPLCCYYGYNVIPMANWSSITVWFSVIFYLSIGMYALVKLPKKTTLSFGIIVFFIGIFPFVNLIMPVVGIVGERFIYFASLGFCIITARLLCGFFKINITNTSKLPFLPSSFKLSLSCILLLGSYLTLARNADWKDELTLFRNDVAHFQNSSHLHYILGNKLYDKIYNTPNGAKKNELIAECKFHYKQASEFLQEGIQKYPTDFTSLNNIGMIYMKIFDDAPAAWPYFKKAMALNPKERMIQFNVAFCCEKRNLPDSAILFYEKAIATNTSYVHVYLNLHELYLKKHAFIQAINCDKKGIIQIPNYTKLYINLGNALMLNKDTVDAVTQYIKAVDSEPTNIELRTKMKYFLMSIGQKEKADKLNSQ